jgi:hypothetical protein
VIDTIGHGSVAALIRRPRDPKTRFLRSIFFMASVAPVLRDVSRDDNTPRRGLLRWTLMRAQLALRGRRKYSLDSSGARHG